MSDFATFIKSFDTENSKGKQFEKFCKWFLENDPVWKSQVKKVWLWDDWPGRWGADLGIDLVFQHINGEIWAVQAKCYSQIYPVTKADIDSFLSESNRPKIHQRLLMASTDIIGPNARKVCANQDKKVTFQLYSDFLDSKLDFPKDISKLGKPKLLPKPKPYPHQANALKDVVNGFKKHDRGQMIMACGTGKTFTTLWIKEKLKAESTLVLLPSLNLLSQTLKEWSSNANQFFQSLAVCSDSTVTKAAEEDSVTESTQDLSFPVSSNPKEIAKFLKMSGSKVVFSTYQSSPMIAEAMKSRSVKPFDLVICDEAHRCVGKAGSQFTTILDDKKIKLKQKLFTTATPRTYSRNVKKAAKDNEIIITGMDDEKVFGPVFHKLSFGEAIERRLLTDYQVVIVGVDEPMIKEWITDRELLEVEEGVSVDAESLAAQIGVLKAIKDYDLKRLITFHGRVKRAENFSKDILAITPFIPKKDLPKGVLKTDYVSGQMPTNKRRQKLKQLKDLFDCNRQILSNARCLSEGVDVPALEGIAIIDPRKSQVDIVQTVGRAIRLSGDKKIGTIIIPVFIENSEDPELAIENSNFKPVYDVLNALKSHDENLAFELDELRTQMGRRKTSTGPSSKIPKTTIDLPKQFSIDFADSIRTILVEKTTESWNFWYGLLKNYFNEHKSSLVGRDFKTSQGYNLGKWVTMQRVKKNKHLISQIRIDLLNDLGFIWDVYDYNWNIGYQLFKNYVQTKGEAFIPNNYITKCGFNLGVWVDRQRSDQRVRKDLKIEYFNKLNALGLQWESKSESAWDDMFIEFVKYIKKYKSVLVPNNFKTHDGKNLGRWVGRQRDHYQAEDLNRLSHERIKKLKKLGFIWNKIEAQWDTAFEALKKYKKVNGSVKMSQDLIFENIRLGMWVSDQRKNYKSKNISTERIKKLESLGCVWDQLEENWNEGYEALKAYKEKAQSTTIPLREKFNGFPLGSWVSVQRKSYLNKIISDERIAKLNKLNFVWNTLDDRWDNCFEVLKKYKKVNGSVKMSQDLIFENIRLGMWVHNQRKNYKNKKMSPDRIAKLDEVGLIL